MSTEQHVVFIPGLHDQEPIHKKLISLLPVVWQGCGMIIHVVYPHWESNEPLDEKLTRIRTAAQQLVRRNLPVALVGQSAGGSAAGNVFLEDADSYTGFINITGRLSEGRNARPSLAAATRQSPSFAESVLTVEGKLKTASSRTREKILTIRPFWDLVVPSVTVGVLGATNLVAPYPDHVVGGVFIDLTYAKRISRFLNSAASKTRQQEALSQ